LSVFDADHPRPSDTADASGVRRALTECAVQQLAALTPKDARTLAEYRRVVGTALREMIHDTLPPTGAVSHEEVGREESGGHSVRKLWITRTGLKEQVPTVAVRGPRFDGDAVVW